MKLYLLISLGILLIAFLAAWILRSNGKEPVSCFSEENFDKAIKYTRWKDKTSKIGKVLVNGYRVKVSEENEILFKEDKDKSDYTIFKVSREKGIILLPVNPSKSLPRKANEAFCELLERAKFHGNTPEN